jgi:uncharacterized membrane protein
MAKARLGRYAIFSLIALMVKEEIAFLVFTMAIYFAIKSNQKPKRKGIPFSFYLLVLALLALVWFYIAVYVIVPQNNLTGRSPYWERYPGTTNSLLNSLGAIPALIASIFIPDKLTYLLQLFASVGFLAVFDPISLLIGAPSLVLNLLSIYPAQYSGTYHYSAPVAPYFVLAAIGGAARIQNHKLPITNYKKVIFVAAFVIVLCYHLIAGYTPIGGAFFWPESTPHQQLLTRFANQIPRDAKVSTTGSLFPHISHREYLSLSTRQRRKIRAARCIAILDNQPG